jgi:hypothetical protein
MTTNENRKAVKQANFKLPDGFVIEFFLLSALDSVGGD